MSNEHSNRSKHHARISDHSFPCSTQWFLFHFHSITFIDGSVSSCQEATDSSVHQPRFQDYKERHSFCSLNSKALKPWRAKVISYLRIAAAGAECCLVLMMTFCPTLVFSVCDAIDCTNSKTESSPRWRGDLSQVSMSEHARLKC